VLGIPPQQIHQREGGLRISAVRHRASYRPYWGGPNSDTGWRIPVEDRRAGARVGWGLQRRGLLGFSTLRPNSPPSVTVGSGPYSVGADLDALSDDFEWVPLDHPRINDDGPSHQGERSEWPVPSSFFRESVSFTGDRPYSLCDGSASQWVWK